MASRWLALLLLFAVGTGCAAGPAASDAPAAERSRPSPTRSTPSNAEVCANQVRYWGRTLLTQGAYQGGDYQHMGLSDAQNEVLRALLAEVAPLAQAQGVEAAVAVVEAQAPARCAEAYASGTPTSAWG